MAATRLLLLQKPTFRLSFTCPFDINQLKPTQFLQYPVSELVSFDRFDCKSVAISKMIAAGFVKTFSIRWGHNKGSVTAFRQESFDKDSVEFPSVFAAEEFEATLNSLSKWIVFAIFVGIMVWRNDAESLWDAVGSLINFVLCLTLKKLFNQQRPLSTLKSDPGMPSSHAQSIFFIFMLSTLSITERLGVNEFTLSMTALALATSSYLSWLRVSQKFHTTNQVVVGAVVGSLFSFVWFWLWRAFVQEAYISFWWVRAMVVIGAATFWLGFLSHLIRHLLDK